MRQLGRVGRTSAGRQDELSDRRLAADPNGRAHVLCWKVVKHATKPNSLSRSRLWVAAGACALTAPASSQAVEQSWERPGVLARSLRHFCCVLADPTRLTSHGIAHSKPTCRSAKKTKPRVPRLPKFPSLSVPVRLAHIEDGCGDSLEQKRDGLYSTETWLCACIIENERLRRCRLPHQKRGA